MYVIIFYWQGDRWQQKDYEQPAGYHNPLQHHINRVGRIADDLPARYINNLFRGVRRFAECDFKFICFTNEQVKVDRGIEIRAFPLVSKMGVLPRLWMFSREAGLFGHQVLCLDLDVVIVGNLRDIMGYKGSFCTRRKFAPTAKLAEIDGDIMSFYAGEENERRFWLPFVKEVERWEHLTLGRERYWIRHCTKDQEIDCWQDLLPGQVVSYKWHARRRLPDNARIVSCHGSPRPHEINNGWIKQYWQ